MTNAPMTNAPSKSIVENAFQAFAGHDPAEIAAVLTEDAEWLSPRENATAVALEAPDHLIGRDAIVRFFSEDFPRLFVRDLALTVNGLHADGERATLEATMRATLADGLPYSNDYCFVFELKDGLIHRVREYVDTSREHRLIFGNGTRTRADN
ncbi:nuclear transport factor 2 family protein [Saccharomonospora sp. NPDC006951]